MINAAGQALITLSEEIRLKAYLCPAGVWTIGRGHTKGVKKGDVITAAQEQDLFFADMREWTDSVLALLKRKPTENQLAAMVSLAFNIGMPRFASSTVLRAFNRGDDAAASRAFGMWNKITHPVQKILVVSNGLVIRRARETALFMTPDDDFAPIEMPQEVAPEKPMSASTINQASVVAGVTTTAATVTTVLSSVKDVKESVHGVGEWAVPLMLVVTMCALGYIVWERFNQRSQGNS